MAYEHLNIHERQLMAKLYAEGKSFREIGRLLNRHHTTISREFKRYHYHYTNDYNPEVSNDISGYFRFTLRHAKRRMYKPLYKHVLKLLKKGYAPDIISGRLTLTHPHNSKMRVSHETIYRWIYNDRLEGGKLYQFLHRRHKRRKHQCLPGYKRSALKDRVSIHDRPDIINARKFIGDWEGDLMEGKRSTGYFFNIR